MLLVVLRNNRALDRPEGGVWDDPGDKVQFSETPGGAADRVGQGNRRDQ